MAQRQYRRSGSPGGGPFQMGVPMRSSTGMLEHPYYDRHYAPSRVGPEVRASPRTSADRFPDPHLPPAGAYQGGRSLSARYPVPYPRARRATLESDQGRRPVIVPSSQQIITPATGALVRVADSDADDDYYIYPATSARRPHQRHLSVDDAERDRHPGYVVRSDRERERERRPEGSGYPRERRKVYHYGAAGLAPSEEDRARYDPGGYRHSGRRSLARDGQPYVEAAPRRRRADSLDAGRRHPLDMSELRQALPPPIAEPRIRVEHQPDRLSIPPQGGPGPIYDSPIEMGKAGLARAGSLRSRRKPVLHHDDDDAAARPRHGVHTDAPYDYERSQRPRDHVDDRDRGVPVAAAVAAAAHHRSPRVREPSPDYSEDDSYRSEPRHRDQAHRHHRHDKHHHHRHSRANNRHDDDRDFEAGRVRAGANYDVPERHARDRPEHDHDVLARAPPPPPPPTEELRQRGYVGRDPPREEDLRSRRDSPPQEPRDQQASGREPRGAIAGYHDLNPRDAPMDRPLDSEGPAGDVSLRPHDERDRGGVPRVAEPDDERPSQRSEHHDDRSSQVRVVSPPRSKEAKPLKGILREPREKFPEDPAPVREGVAPLKETLKDGRKGIPPGARWTKIDRRRVNPAALTDAHERFEERSDHVIVLRVLTREEIEALALRTQQIRGT